MDLKKLSDSELVALMKGGNKAAFDVIFSRYYDLFHTFAKKLVKDASVSEDIMQNVFLKFWLRRAQVNSEMSIKNYLLVMTRNEVFDYMRLRYNLLKADCTDEDIEKADKSKDAYEKIAEREKNAMISAAISTMPDQRKKIFTMRYGMHLSNSEIAERLNISVRTVEKHIGLGIKQIQQYIESQGK